jgi:hypothetical protein
LFIYECSKLGIFPKWGSSIFHHVNSKIFIWERLHFSMFYSEQTRITNEWAKNDLIKLKFKKHTLELRWCIGKFLSIFQKPPCKDANILVESETAA